MVLVISSCSHWNGKEKIKTEYTNRYSFEKELVSFTSCSGKGQIISKNPLRGKLYFTFLSNRDSSQVYVKDFLGRRLYSIKGNNEQIFITDHHNNIVHDFNNLVNTYTLDKILTPVVLQKYLWGETQITIPTENGRSESNKLNGSLIFISKKAKKDGLLDTVIINLNEPKIELSIEILNREFFEFTQFIPTELIN
tara:strand:- start:588 stop:1172 length:585 start_codon:yes stop_codon:yes gene_type:complete